MFTLVDVSTDGTKMYVKDTSDGVVEEFSVADVLGFVESGAVEIEGIKKDKKGEVSAVCDGVSYRVTKSFITGVPRVIPVEYNAPKISAVAESTPAVEVTEAAEDEGTTSSDDAVENNLNEETSLDSAAENNLNEETSLNSVTEEEMYAEEIEHHSDSSPTELEEDEIIESDSRTSTDFSPAEVSKEVEESTEDNVEAAEDTDSEEDNVTDEVIEESVSSATTNLLANAVTANGYVGDVGEGEVTDPSEDKGGTETAAADLSDDVTDEANEVKSTSDTGNTEDAGNLLSDLAKRYKKKPENSGTTHSSTKAKKASKSGSTKATKKDGDTVKSSKAKTTKATSSSKSKASNKAKAKPLKATFTYAGKKYSVTLTGITGEEIAKEGKFVIESTRQDFVIFIGKFTRGKNKGKNFTIILDDEKCLVDYHFKDAVLKAIDRQFKGCIYSKKGREVVSLYNICIGTVKDVDIYPTLMLTDDILGNLAYRVGVDISSGK